MAMGLAGLPSSEWMIKDARGRKFNYDSQDEAFEELHEYGEGATVWTREVYRVLFITKSIDGWKQVAAPQTD